MTWLKVIVIVSGLLFVASASAVAGTIFAFSRNLPSLDELERNTLAQTTTIFDRDGKVIAELHGQQNRYVVKSGQIPDLMKYATVAKEDERFYQHHGIDFQGLARAMAANVEAGSIVQGGSTITEQYVKNTYLTFDRTMKRKIDEAILSWQLEDEWTKDRIITAYLNTVYYGEGAYGVQAAARTFFDKDVSDLTLPQIALLAALPKSPNEFSPIANPTAARSQRNFVLERMQQQGYITDRQMVVGKKSKLGVKKTTELAYEVKDPAAAYFVAAVVKDLSKHYTDAEVFGGGLKVYTTIDMQAQKHGIATVKPFMGQPGDPAVALVSVEPATGYIRTMVGGLDYTKQKINWATQGQRQAGSAMKTFTLVAAPSRRHPGEASSEQRHRRGFGDHFEVRFKCRVAAGATIIRSPS